MVKITCKTHGSDVSAGRCPECYQTNVDAFNRAFAGMSITHGGFRGHEQTVLVNGEEVPWRHEDTDVEYTWIPKDIGARVHAFIEQEIKRYRATCNCANCQLERDTCPECRSTGFAKSKTGKGCEFCDGTEGGVGP